MLEIATFMFIDYHRAIGVVDQHRTTHPFLFVLSAPLCDVEDGSVLVGNRVAQHLNAIAFALFIVLVALAELFNICKGTVEYPCDQVLWFGVVVEEKMSE